MFNKLKVFPAYCTFCNKSGSVIGAITNKNAEVAVCGECSHKLILGISTALEEMERTNQSKVDHGIIQAEASDIQDAVPAT